METWLDWLGELQSLAQAGIYYTKDPYDRERFERVRELAALMVAEGSETPLEDVRFGFLGDEGYQTPKISVRTAAFREGKLLLIEEKRGAWNLPGGWCEFNLSPRENALKEIQEEAGREAEILKLIWAKEKEQTGTWKHPFKIVEMVYLARDLGGTFEANLETQAADFFTLEEALAMKLELLSEEELRLCFEAAEADSWEARI